MEIEPVPHTYPLPLDRVVTIYVDFASTRLDGEARTVTAEQVLNIVAAVDSKGAVIPVDEEKYNLAGIDDIAVAVGVEILATLIAHGMIYVGKAAWKQFWSRPKREIVKDTKVADNPDTELVIAMAILFIRDSDPDTLAAGWQGPKKE
jgi:hypothetical protein